MRLAHFIKMCKNTRKHVLHILSTCFRVFEALCDAFFTNVAVQVTRNWDRDFDLIMCATNEYAHDHTRR